MREARAAGRSMDEDWSRTQKDIEIDRSMRAFADAGLHVDLSRLRRGRRGGAGPRARRHSPRRTGRSKGIVHGAGIERAAAFERKMRDSVLQTIAVKVDGALNLMRLTQNDPVRHFIGFGSVSGRLGSNGQTDYCLASDMLCKLASWYRHATARASARSASTGTPGAKWAWPRGPSR